MLRDFHETDHDGTDGQMTDVDVGSVGQRTDVDDDDDDDGTD